MQLLHNGQVNLSTVRGLFPRQSQAEVAIVDYLIGYAASAYAGMTSYKPDPALECFYAEPLFVPHNQTISSGVSSTIINNGNYVNPALPTVNWQIQNLAGPAVVQMYQAPGWGYQAIDIHATNDASASQMQVTAFADLSQLTFQPQGLTLPITRSSFIPIAPSASSYTRYYVTVAAEDPVNGIYATYKYGVEMGIGEYARVVLSIDGGNTYRTICPDMQTGLNPMQGMGNTTPNNISNTMFNEIRVMNGMISIKVGGQSNAFTSSIVELFTRLNTPTSLNQTATIPVQSSIRCYIKDITLKVVNFSQLGFGLHLTKWQTTASLISPPQQLGFVPVPNTVREYIIHDVNNGTPVADGSSITPFFPTTSTVNVATAQGIIGTSISQYQLTLNNQQSVLANGGVYGDINYADMTAAVTRVTMKMAGIVTRQTYAPTIISLTDKGANAPKDIYEEFVFVPERMTIKHNLNMQFTNWQGVDDFATRTGVLCTGNVGVQVWLGYQHLPGEQGNPAYCHFTGVCETYTFSRPNWNTALIGMQCSDQLDTMLSDRQLFAPPDQDAHNHYYAMANLALLGGMTMDRLGFAAKVPSSPYSPSPPGSLTNGEKDYFLPPGRAMASWTPRNRALSVVEMMEMVRKMTGFLLYIDRFGMLQYTQWVPGNVQSPKKVFNETATYGYGYAGGNIDECWNLTATSSTRNVRNNVSNIGLNPFRPEWGPLIGANRTDQASIESPQGSQPVNYIGWPKDFLWMDARFSDYNFANQSNLRLYNYLRQPEYMVNFTTWFQPNIFPLDVIYVDDSRSNLGSLPLYVMSISNHLSAMGSRKVYESTIQARYLSPYVFA